MSSDQVRLGIIGTGLATEKLHWPALRQMPERFRIVAFANHTRPKAEAFAALAGLSMDDYHASYADLLARSDVDAVLVSLPIPLLYAATRDALLAGKHVLCEKPAGANLEQGLQFLALAEQFPDRKVLIGENYFYRDDLRLARSLLDAGVIGRAHQVVWRVVMQSVPRAGSYTDTRWRQAPSYRGGPFLDGGVHHVAQLRMLVGDVQSLQAWVQYANPTMGGPSGLVLNLHFVSNAIGSFASAYLALPTPGETNEMRMYGPEGTLVVSGGTERLLRVMSADGQVTEHAFETDGGYYNQCINFYEAIVHDAPIVGTIEQSVHNLLIVMRALDSAETRQIVDLSDAPGGLREEPIPLWLPRGAGDLFDGLPTKITKR